MAVAVALTFEALQSSISGADATWTGVSVGAAAADRIVVLNVTSSRNAGIANIVSATCNGNAMTAIQTQQSLGVEAARQFMIELPTGTTADFVVTFSVSLVTGQVYASGYRVTGALPTPADSGGDTSTDMDATDPLSVSVTIPPGGAFIAVSGHAGTTAGQRTWANATEDYDSAAGGANATQSGAHSMTAGSPTITCTGSTNGEDGALAYVIFAAAPTSEFFMVL